MGVTWGAPGETCQTSVRPRSLAGGGAMVRHTTPGWVVAGHRQWPGDVGAGSLWTSGEIGVKTTCSAWCGAHLDPALGRQRHGVSESSRPALCLGSEPWSSVWKDREELPLGSLPWTRKLLCPGWLLGVGLCSPVRRRWAWKMDQQLVSA